MPTVSTGLPETVVNDFTHDIKKDANSTANNNRINIIFTQAFIRLRVFEHQFYMVYFASLRPSSTDRS